MDCMIVGLGNPGAEYARTRHNIGFRIVDFLAERANATFRTAAKALVAETGGMLLVKPQTFMNLSGEALPPLLAAHRLPPERVLVVVDDIHLDLGCLRIRASGSAGGHNGLTSIEEALATRAYPRLRVGVSHEGESDLIDHVLGAFEEEEEAVVREVIPSAAAAIRTWNRDGLKTAQERFNGWLAPSVKASRLEDKTDSISKTEKEA